MIEEEEKKEGVLLTVYDTTENQSSYGGDA